ncbi:putative membrane protein [Plasmodium gaboni]|uniref:Putative membrane protein n=1 Tax=Plasmodium gaboni TaxID=647221 RepID=A0A151LD45_9APIC|nr:putative membrane protein [Plasmodium gaboni]KYN96882.1 putative membrane protein [Plasmodium gaboni]
MEKTSFKNNQKSYSKRHSSLKKKVTNDKNDNSLLTIYSFISNYMLKEEVNYDENDNRYILLESQDFENESGLKKVSFGEFNEKSYSLSHKRKEQNEEDIDKEEEVYEDVDQADYEEEDYEEEDYEEDDYEEDDYEEEDYEEDDYQDDDYQLNDDEEKPYNYDHNQIDSNNVNNDHNINSTNIKQNNSIIRRGEKKKKNKIYNNDNFPNEEDIQIDHNINEENHSRQLWKKKRKKKRKRAKKNMYTNMKNKEIDNNKKGIYKGNNLAKYFTLSMENINEQENIFKDEKQLSRQMSYYNDAYYYTSEMIYKNNRRNKEKFALYLRLMSLFINIIIGIYLIIYFPHTNNDKDTFDGTFKNMDIKDREDIKHIISKNLEINKDYHNYMKKVNLNVSILNKQKELFENKSIINGKGNTNTNSSDNNSMHVNSFDRNTNSNDSVINTNNTNNNNNNNNFVRFLRNIFSSNNYEQEDNLKSLPNSINKEKTNNNTSIKNTGYYNLYKNNNNNIIDVEKNIYDENDKNNNLKKKNLKNVKINNYNSGVYYVNDKDMLKDIKTKEDINNLIYMIDILNLMDDEHIMIYIYNEMNKIYKYAIYSFFGELLVISIIVFSLFILKILINDNNKFSVILTMYGIFYKIFCYIFAHYVLFMGLYILSIYYNIYINRDIYTHSYNFFCYHYVYNNLYIHLLMLFYALQNIVFTINDAFNCIRMVFILIKHVIIKIYEKITCKNFITFYELKEDKSPLSLTCFNKLKNKCNMNCKCCKDKNCVEIDIDEMHDIEYEKNKLPLFPNFNRKPYCKNLNIKTYEQSLLNMRNPIFK